MNLRRVFSLFLSVLCTSFCGVFGKYMEGELHTSENFAFLARFCFLSEEGQFEYYFEYEEDQGEPNLLLYYDADDQWPAIYKTNKSCWEKESVLRPEQNQIVNLTARAPYYKELSGCIVTPTLHTTSLPKYTIMLPTVKNDYWQQYPQEGHHPTSPMTTSSFITKTTTPMPKIVLQTSTSLPTDTKTVTSGKGEGKIEITSFTTPQTIITTTTSDIVVNNDNNNKIDDLKNNKTSSSSSLMVDESVDLLKTTPTTTSASSSSPSFSSSSTNIGAGNIKTKSGLLSVGSSSSSSSSSILPDLVYTLTPDISTKFEDKNLEVENIQEEEVSTFIPIPVASKLVRRTKPVEKSSTAAPKQQKARRIVCRNARRFRSARERWWFLAVSNCNSTKGIHIKYKILMTNGPQGDYWHEHFSADEFYILPILMAFCIAYCFLLLAIVICSIELKSRQLLHSTYKLFVLSVLLQFFGIMMESMAYLNYAVNGVGAPKAKTVGAIFMAASETTFLLLLLLLAKGYTITRGRLPINSSVKLTIFMCVYVVMYLSLFVYEAKVFDPGEVLYLYESPAGYGLIILRIAAWCMFIYSTVFTLKHYPEKASFYYPFNICGTLWYIAGPAFILSANSYIDKWVRESIVAAVLLFITFGGHLMFLILTMPSVANKNFPYHVRTTQIGVMELTGSNAIEQFNHHPYEPAGGPDQAVIIPLTRRTEEIFGGLYTQRLNIHRTSNAQENTEREENLTMERFNDITMQNVLSWSIAKNFNPMELGVFHQIDRSYLGSPYSHSNSERSLSLTNQQEEGVLPVTRDRSGGGERGTTGTRRKESIASLDRAQNLVPNGHSTQDWVKEVPVELFTISKAVANANLTPKTNNEPEHDK